MNPQCISREEIPEADDVNPQVACLLLQPDIKDPDRSVQDTIDEIIAKVGENIKVSRFARFEVGSQKSER
jgi:elongation factor Ts